MNAYVIINNNASSYAYLVYSCGLWHGRLRNVNFSYIKKMADLSIIPKFSLENRENVNLVWNLK